MISSGRKVIGMRIYSYLFSGIPKYLFYVNAFVLGLRCGYNTIPHDFVYGDVIIRRAHVSRVLNRIAPKYYSGTVGFIFLRLVFYHNVDM